MAEVVGILRAILDTDPVKAQLLLAALDSRCLARGIDQKPETGPALALISVVLKTDTAAGQSLLRMLDIPRLIAGIKERAGDNFEYAVKVIRMIQRADPVIGAQVVQGLGDVPQLLAVLRDQENDDRC